tara:strand:+ start:719 stop:1090 length:372 start_codon:yes stop_codon:yes gene_type:complete
MNKTLPFTSNNRLLMTVNKLKRENYILKYNHKRSQVNFLSMVHRIESDLKSKQQAEMADYDRHYDWLVTNVLEQEQKKKDEIDKLLKDQEQKMNKAYIELYQRYNLDHKRMQERIEELENSYK